MDKRKKLILATIVKEHIKTGAPVGSEVLVDKYKLNISPATARNEMAELERESYIVQPHTSAGRIPTEKAYNLMLEGLKEKKLSKKEEDALKEALAGKDEAAFKKTAKAMAAITDGTVFWAFHKNNLFYTGITNLLQQPEFSAAGLIYDISAIIDKMDEIIDDIFEKTAEGEHIIIGSENPFSDLCGTVIAKYRLHNQSGLFGIMGPMRMDYEKNLTVVKYIKKMIAI